MPIVGGTPEECFNLFRDHVAKLVKDTLPTKDIVIAQKLKDDRTKCVLTLGRPDQISVPLRSDTHGKIHVYLAQQLRVVPHNKGAFRLTANRQPHGARFRGFRHPHGAS